MNTKKNRLIRALKMISLMLGGLLFCANAFALTPSEALEKAKKAIDGAKSIEAEFTLKYNGATSTGTLYGKGSKFAIVSSVTSNWYNGNDLYTYDPTSKETYVFNPTAAELSEINPLLYIKSSGDYKVAGTKNPKKGVETVTLIPKTKSSGVKSVTLEIDSKTFLPKTIKVIPTSGGTLTLTINKATLNKTLTDSTFEYPKTKYPNVKLIDMR